MFSKITENFHVNYVLARTLSSSAKLAGCMFAPKSSTQIFTKGQSENLSSALAEAFGGGKPKLLCAAGILSKDVADLGMWLYEIDLIEDVVDYANSLIQDLNKEEKGMGIDSMEYISANLVPAEDVVELAGYDA